MQLRDRLRVMSISDGDITMEVLPGVGGRVHRLRAFEHDVLRTPPDVAAHLAEPFLWGSYPLVPWSNRVPDGRLHSGGAVHQLPLNLPGHAIHGQGYEAPWQVIAPGRLRFRGGGDAFPWRYTAEQRFAIEDGAVVWDIDVRNDSDTAMPAGLGFHPWFPVTADATITIPAASVYPSREQVPTGDPVPVHGRYDLRRPTQIPFGVDDVWTDLTEQRLTLTLPEKGLVVEIVTGATATHVVMAAFADLGAVAVEAVTHATDGHARRARGERGGIDVIEPGQTLGLRQVTTIRRASPCG